MYRFAPFSIYFRPSDERYEMKRNLCTALAALLIAILAGLTACRQDRECLTVLFTSDEMGRIRAFG